MPGVNGKEEVLKLPPVYGCDPGSQLLLSLIDGGLHCLHSLCYLLQIPHELYLLL